MIYEIKNERLTVSADTAGGQLRSIRDNEGREYLWQGDPAIWKESAPNLFPYIARMTDKSYTYEGKTYRMEIHGFLKYMELELVKCEGDTMVMALESSEETRSLYPFEFRVELEYRLTRSALEITYRVINKDDKTMYFGIGGHPGFNVPLEEGHEFTDYYLDFGGESAPLRVGMSKDCFVTGEDQPYPLRDGRFLDLRHDLFDDDAIILKGMPRAVTLGCAAGNKEIRVEFPDMPYLGVWHKPKMIAPYVCIEPWTSLPSRKGVVEALETQENLISLEQGGTYENNWSITVADASRE